MSVLDAMLVASREWAAATFSGHLRHVQECQGSIAMIVTVGRDKLSFLDVIPYLLCRLGEAGVRDRIVRQWREIPAEAHDPVSIEFLMEGTLLRRQIDELPDGECELPQPLRRERQSLIDICFETMQQRARAPPQVGLDPRRGRRNGRGLLAPCDWNRTSMTCTIEPGN